MTHSVLLHPAGTYLTLKPKSVGCFVSVAKVDGALRRDLLSDAKRNETQQTVIGFSK